MDRMSNTCKKKEKTGSHQVFDSCLYHTVPRVIQSFQFLLEQSPSKNKFTLLGKQNLFEKKRKKTPDKPKKLKSIYKS